MNLKEKLSHPIGMEDIRNIIFQIQGNSKKLEELLNLLVDENDKIACQSAWVLTHLPSEENKKLYDKQDILIDAALTSKHIGKQRSILTLLYKQPLIDPLRIDFLNFCLDKMISKHEPIGIQSLCMKIAYELCRSIPELKQELQIALEMIEGELSPAIQVARKNILKAMVTGRSLQKISFR